MYDVIIMDQERGGERVDLSTGSLRYAGQRMSEINRSERSRKAGVTARVQPS